MCEIQVKFLEKELVLLNETLLKCRADLEELENRLTMLHGLLQKAGADNYQSQESILKEINRLVGEARGIVTHYDKYLMKFVCYKAILTARNSGASDMIQEDLLHMYQGQLAAMSHTGSAFSTKELAVGHLATA
jgi:uncharacterized coiled-coil protein SlyX